jgi:heptosyltransferase-2
MKSVLVVRLSSLGDIVLTQPVLAQIQREGGCVDLLVSPAYANLAGMLPGADRVLCSAQALRPAYDLVLDLHATLKARRALQPVHGRSLVRYGKHGLARRLLVRPKGRPVFWNAWSGLRSPQSVVQWYGAAAQRVGFQMPASLIPEVTIPETAQAQARQLLKKVGLSASEPIALLAPGAKWETKQWPLAYFGQAAQGLHRGLGLRPVFIGGPDEAALCQEAARLAGSPAVTLAGQTDFPVLAALFQKAGVAVTNDSGPLHLGLAAGSRVVALLGPTVPAFGFAPMDHPRAAVLSLDLACRPCSLHGSRQCPLGHRDCLRKIRPEDVVRAATALMEK